MVNGQPIPLDEVGRIGVKSCRPDRMNEQVRSDGEEPEKGADAHNGQPEVHGETIGTSLRQVRGAECMLRAT